MPYRRSHTQTGSSIQYVLTPDSVFFSPSPPPSLLSYPLSFLHIPLCFQKLPEMSQRLPAVFSYINYSNSFSIRSLASGAWRSIFSGNPNMDTHAILSPPAFGASRLNCLFAKSIFLKVANIPSKSTSPSPIARC